MLSGISIRLRMKPLSVTSKGIAFGAGIGVGVGLLVDTLLLVPTSMFFLMAIWPVILPPALGLAVGAFLGWMGWMPSVSWTVSVFGGIALWALCIWIPIRVREWQFNSLAYRQIPAFPGAKLTTSRIDPYMTEGGSDVYLEFCVGEKTNKVLQFYQSELVRRGWTAFPKRSAGGVEPYDWYPFSKDNRYLSLYICKGCSWGCPDESFIQIHCSLYNYFQRKQFLPNGWQ